MKPVVLEALGIFAMIIGAACLATASWLIAGIPAALIVGGVLVIAGGYSAVRAAALSERGAP